MPLLIKYFIEENVLPSTALLFLADHVIMRHRMKKNIFVVILVFICSYPLNTNAISFRPLQACTKQNKQNFTLLCRLTMLVSLLLYLLFSANVIIIGQYVNTVTRQQIYNIYWVTNNRQVFLLILSKRPGVFKDKTEGKI